MPGWLTVPRDLLARSGEIVKFCGQVFGDVLNGRVFRFFGEALRQAGILILGSALVIWGMVFILGLECGIEGACLGALDRRDGQPDLLGSEPESADRRLTQDQRILASAVLLTTPSSMGYVSRAWR